jgi:hypothetical protein
MPVGKVPAARPATYIESGTVASEISGANVAPTIEPVAKITAELAPVGACAAASRNTLARTRVSSASRTAAVTSIIGGFYPGKSAGREKNRPATRSNMKRLFHAINRRKRARAMRRRQVEATGAIMLVPAENQRQIVRRHIGNFDQRKTGAVRKPLDGLGVAHAPFEIAVAKACVKGRVATGGMPAIALERPIEKKRPAFGQRTSCAG